MTVIHYYARFAEHKSGVTESIATWAEFASECFPTEVWMSAVRGREVHRDLARLERARVGVRRIPHFGSGRRTYVPIIPLSRIHAGDTFVVHEGWVLSNLVALVAAKIRGATCVCVPHGVYEPQLVSHIRDVLGIRRRVERATLALVDYLHVFYSTEAALAAMVAGRVLPYEAVPNPVPNVSESELWSSRDSHSYYLWMGRYDVLHKGLDILLESWRLLERPRASLLLVGPDSGGGKARVRELVRDLGLEESVRVGDSVDGAEKVELVRGAICYVHPSRWESCSMVLNEMLAAGVPCFVSDRIHAALPLETAGVATLFGDAESLAGLVSACAVKSLGSESGRRTRAQEFGVEEVKRHYQGWLLELGRAGLDELDL